MAKPGTYDPESLSLSGKPVQTARLRLRPFEAGDAHAFWLMASNPNVMRFIPRDLATDEKAEKARFMDDLRAGQRFRFLYAVTCKDAAADARDGMLGWVKMTPTEDGRFVELGYWYREEFWGMGLAIEAGHAVLEAAMADLNLPWCDVYAYVLQGNHASRKLLTKLGLEYRRDRVIGGNQTWELYGPGAETY